MIAVHDKAVLRRDIFLTVDLQVDIAGFDRTFKNLLDVLILLHLRILVRVLGIMAQLAIQAGDAQDIFQNHQCDTIQNHFLLISSLPETGMRG